MARKIKKVNNVKVYYDHVGNTLNVWFDDPIKEYTSEEMGDNVVLNKDRKGHVIGFEKINFRTHTTKGSVIPSLPVELFVS